MNDVITVCICVYNAGSFLQETLDSLEKQSYQKFEYLIIDDGSTDNSVEVIKQFEKHSSREVNTIFIEKNKGTAYCRNLAINTVKTELMMFFDSDDIAKPNLLECLFSRINQDYKCIAVSCYSDYIDINGNYLKCGQHIGPVSQSEFMDKASQGKLIFMLPITLFKKEFALKAGGYRTKGFPENSNIRYQDLSEDLDMWSRISDFYNEGYYMITIPEALFMYRKSRQSLSTGEDKQFAMQLKMRYIKTNLKLRRDNKAEISFIEFIDKMSKREYKSQVRTFKSGYHYRNAAFSFVDKCYFKAFLGMCLAFFYSPKYMLNKIKSISKI